MQNFFLRLYVATKVHMTERREDGFVTAEHLAIAVLGVILVAGAYTLFKGQINTYIANIFQPSTDAANAK